MEMVKTVVQRKPTAPVAQDNIERSLAVLTAKQQFLSASMSMGWQLAGMVLIPVIIGVKLDEHFSSSPSYTLAALVLAVGGAVLIIRKTIKQVDQEQAIGGSSTSSQQKKEKN